MKTVPSLLAAHLRGEVTTTALCWRIMRTDGVILGFTAHDRALTIGDVRYRAAGGMSATAIAAAADLSPKNLEVSGALEAQGLSAAEIGAGCYDGAQVEVFLANWADPDAGTVLLQRGTLGAAEWDGAQYRVELRGLAVQLQRIAGAVYTPDCRAALGDRFCRVPLSAHQWEVGIAAVSGLRGLELSGALPVNGYLAHGRMRVHTGANAGRLFSIQRHAGTSIMLLEVPPSAFAAGDRATVWEGCDKRFQTCRTRFSNGQNFRGEPYVPGVDDLMSYPGAN